MASDTPPRALRPRRNSAEKALLPLQVCVFRLLNPEKRRPPQEGPKSAAQNPQAVRGQERDPSGVGPGEAQLSSLGSPSLPQMAPCLPPATTLRGPQLPSPRSSAGAPPPRLGSRSQTRTGPEPGAGSLTWVSSSARGGGPPPAPHAAGAALAWVSGPHQAWVQGHVLTVCLGLALLPELLDAGQQAGEGGWARGHSSHLAGACGNRPRRGPYTRPHRVPFRAEKPTGGDLWLRLEVVS